MTLDLTRQGSIRSGDACETDRVREVREPVRGRHKYISREEAHACQSARTCVGSLLCEDGVWWIAAGDWKIGVSAPISSFHSAWVYTRI